MAPSSATVRRLRVSGVNSAAVMFEASDRVWAPWYVVHTDDKRRGRLNLITHLLSQVPYEPIKRPKVSLPHRDKPGDYVEGELGGHHIPTPF